MNIKQNPNIVIVTYERLNAIKKCIESVLKNTPEPINLILVDNGSSRHVQDFLLTQPGIKVFINNNLGLYKALNIGMRLIKDELVAFLDSDIIVTPGWWEALATEVYSDEKIGLAGSRYLNPDGSLQEGFPILSSKGWYGENKEDRNQAADCQYIAIGCSVFRRSAWEAANGFDETYFISHGDIDFCYKLRYELGLRIRYCPKSSVIHDHLSFKEPEYDQVRFNKKIVSSDYNQFYKKWQSYYKYENNN